MNDAVVLDPCSLILVVTLSWVPASEHSCSVCIPCVCDSNLLPTWSGGMWGRRVYWRRLSPHRTLTIENADELCAHNNLLQTLSGRRGVSHWIYGDGRAQVRQHTHGVPNVPRRRTQNQRRLQHWNGEQEQPVNHRQFSSQIGNPSQHHLFTQIHSFWASLYLDHQSQHRGPRPRAHWYMC